jgi:hypothetical protein
MTQKEHEEHRRALEQELQADLALIHAAHEARLRSLDRLRQLATEGNEPGAVSGPFTAAPNRPATSRDAVPPPPPLRASRRARRGLPSLPGASHTPETSADSDETPPERIRIAKRKPETGHSE